MRAQNEGRIINIAPFWDILRCLIMALYRFKFALEGLTDTLRLELYDSDIYVSLIEPGMITTQFGQNSLKCTFLNRLTSSILRIKIPTNACVKIENQPLKRPPFTLTPEAVVKKNNSCFRKFKTQDTLSCYFSKLCRGGIKAIIA